MTRLILIAATVVLGACNGASPAYQAAGAPNSVGHFAAPADNGRYVVGYTGDKGMSAAQVAEFALLRAAEVTSAAGQDWFAVLENRTLKVQAGDVNNIQGRTGSVLSTGSTGAGAGGAGNRSGAAPGVSDGSVPTGPSTGGFGGGDVPYQVIERWRPPTVHQTTIVIQMGSGKSASFEGLAKAPEIYSAKAVADEIRAKTTK